MCLIFGNFIEWLFCTESSLNFHRSSFSLDIVHETENVKKKKNGNNSRKSLAYTSRSSALFHDFDCHLTQSETTTRMGQEGRLESTRNNS